MAVKVITSDGGTVTFDSADKWAVESGLLSIGTDRQPDGMFQPAAWAYVVLIPETTKN